MHAHRDQDVYRWAIAHRVAREKIAGRRRGQPQVRRTPRGEVVTASAKRDGAQAFLAMIQMAKAGKQ